MGLSFQEISILLQEAREMKTGRILTKETCPICRRPFLPGKRRLECPEHKTTPSRFFLDLWWNKERKKIYSDQEGKALSSYDQAYLLLAQINKEIEGGVFSPDNYVKKDLSKFWTMTLLDRFLKFKKAEIAPSYRNNYRVMVEAAKDFFKSKDVRKIRKVDLEDYKKHLLDGERTGKTLKNYMDHFRAFFNWCRQTLEIETAPIWKWPEVEVPESKFLWLSQNDQAEIWEKIPGDDRPIFDFMALHGCRPSEARALRIRDIDLRTGMITIRSTWSGKEIRERRKGRKAKPAVIPLHPDMADFIASRASQALPEAFVFINPRTGEAYSQNRLRKIWDKVRKREGINRGLRLYDATRHTFGSRLGNFGVPLQEISRLMGHSSSKMTERYVHSDVERLKANLRKLSLKKVSEFPLSVPGVSPERKTEKKDK